MNHKLLTVPDLCRELKIGQTTAYKLLRSGAIPHTKIGRKIVIQQSDLQQFIAESAMSPK